MVLERFALEFGVIFKKRLFELRYGWGPYVSNGVASIVFTIMTGAITIFIYTARNRAQVQTYEWSAFSEANHQFAISANASTDFLHVAAALEQATGLSARVYGSRAELERRVFESRERFAFGLDVTAATPSVFVGKVYYNGTAASVETEKTRLTVALMKLLYAADGQSSIDFVYEPLNSGLNTARLWGFFGPLMMSFAVLNIGSALGTTLVADRENFRLHSMVTSGLRVWVYWLSNWVFDTIVYLFYVVIDWLILLAFGTDALVTNSWMGTFFTFVFCAFETLPLVYLISLFFDSLQSINAFLQNILIVITLVPYFIVTLVLDNDLDEATALIISIVPSYAVQHGLNLAAKRAVGKPITHSEVWEDEFMHLYCVMIGSAVLYSVLCVIVSYFRNRAKGKNIKDIEGEKSEADEDVAAMEQAVLQGEFDEEAIVVKNLDKVYVDSNGHAFKAVNKVSLYVKRGELFGVLGANGAGKSTLMAVITGRTNATGGQILILGNNILTGADSKEYVSICPQFDNHLFPMLTPRQHFQLYGRLKGYSDDELQQQIDDYEGLMNLGQFGERRVSQLSGGNARKLSIALAFLGSAPIIFLDEPTASLDPVARLQTQALIAEKAGGRTILLCTHLLSEAEKLCDRMCIMLKGKVHAVGTHRHLSEKFGTKWKVEIGLVSDDQECREKVNRFMLEHFPGAELAGTRYSAATYNVPSAEMQLPEVFVILSENRAVENGYTYFTCSMSTLERVFIDLVMQAEA
jgi:ABC-type multidrug transport system ATPase subunit